MQLAAQLFLGTPVADLEALASLGVRLLADVVVVVTISAIYARARGDGEHLFTFLAVNVILFLITQLMVRVELGVGAGFGLFALFGILRYRTDAVPVREMTYLFAVVAAAVANGLGPLGLSWAEVVGADVVIVVLMAVLEALRLRRQVASQSVLYDRLDYLHPARSALLLADLRERTGLDVESVVVRQLNFLNETAQLRIRFRAVAGGDGGHRRGDANGRPGQTVAHIGEPEALGAGGLESAGFTTAD